LGVIVLSITIDQKTISASLAGQIDLDSIINELELPESSNEVKCVTIEEHGFMLSRELQPGDALLTISLTPDGPLAALTMSAREEALGRILKCTTRLIAGRSSSIPVAWRAFHKKNRLAFQANRLLRSVDGGRTDAGRVVMELSQESGPRVFAFMLDRDGRQELGALQPNLEIQWVFRLKPTTVPAGCRPAIRFDDDRHSGRKPTAVPV
jgi:hypothetical protein